MDKISCHNIQYINCLKNLGLSLRRVYNEEEGKETIAVLRMQSPYEYIFHHYGAPFWWNCKNQNEGDPYFFLGLRRLKEMFLAVLDLEQG